MNNCSSCERRGMCCSERGVWGKVQMALEAPWFEKSLIVEAKK